MQNPTSSLGKTESVAIVGARGYSGLQLARLLMRHPAARLETCFATEGGFTLGRYLPDPAAAGVPVLAMSDLESQMKKYATVFLATPAEASVEWAPRLVEAGVNVIDLSGAFRLQGKSREDRLALYKRWYKMEHGAADLVAEAEFGLVPWSENSRGRGGRGRLIANPGCYSTSVLMALLPLLREKMIKPESLVIDAKSGASGAGKKAAENLLFTEVDGECLPYRVGMHQHLPEICEYVHKYAGVEIDPHFTTHLLPVRRGIISGIYARLTGPLAQMASDGDRVAAVARAYETHYAAYPLVQHQALNEGDAGFRGHLLTLKGVVGSGHVALNYQVKGDKLYVFSLIDNLMKGAASQAVENFNRLLDLPASAHLSDVEGVL